MPEADPFRVDDTDPYGLYRKDEQGRRLVSCDEWCSAFQEPETPEEIRVAYIHWRDHGFLSGCAHGN
jgi:hypothetical protein